MYREVQEIIHGAFSCMHAFFQRPGECLLREREQGEHFLCKIHVALQDLSLTPTNQIDTTTAIRQVGVFQQPLFCLGRGNEISETHKTDCNSVVSGDHMNRFNWLAFFAISSSSSIWASS